MSLIIRILFNSLAILISALTIKNVEFSGKFPMLILAGAILAVANLILKPILKILSFPLIALTFGIFSFFISLATLWITDQIIADLAIKTFPALFLATIITGLFNLAYSAIKR